jgi:16S rRNA (uracil1498-N3)-methyltransferase
MLKIFVRQPPDSENILHLDRAFKKRLTKVMRLQVGDRLEVFMPGKHFQGELFRIYDNGIDLRLTKELPSPAPARVHLILAQAIPKGERFEWLIQKSTEIGVAEILPLITKRTVVKPANIDAKIQRWNEIAEHSAGQSENSFPVFVHSPLTLTELIDRNIQGLKLLLHEREGAVSLRSAIAAERPMPQQVIIMVGPEGGWSDDETLQLQQAGFSKVHLGHRILRAETAGIVVAAIVQYELGDFAD